MKRLSVDACLAQFFSDDFGGVFGGNEDQHALPRVLRDQVTQQLRATWRIDSHGALLDVGLGFWLARHLHVGSAYLLLLVFASAVIWLGTLVGLKVRAPDAVMGIAFVGVFPLTFLSNAFVPISTLPTALEYVAAYNPVSVMVAAVRELFGNPTAPITKHVWPLEHPVLAAWGWSIVLLAIAAPLALRRFQKVTTD